MKRLGISKAFVTLVVLVSCSSLLARPTVDQENLADANADFAFRLMREVAREHPGRNIFLSPYSVSIALQMVGNGAAGRTKDEMQRILGAAGLKWETINLAAQQLDESLRRQTNVELRIANAVWYPAGIELKPEFTSLTKEFYRATLAALDFSKPRSVDIMNAWAEENTRGRIRGIVDGSVDPLTKLFLANATYFKGSWQDRFDARETKPRVFHLWDGREKETAMMRRTGVFLYQHGHGFQMVRLPYAGERLAMYVLLPDAKVDVANVLGILEVGFWHNLVRRELENKEGTVVLPRFKLEYGVSLKSSLNSLGMSLAFRADLADFSGMSPNPFYIGKVKQESFVEVNEEGTEAAAVTIVEAESIGYGGAEKPKPFEMIVDRPFLFVIQDSETGTILFMATVFEPM